MAFLDDFSARFAPTRFLVPQVNKQGQTRLANYYDWLSIDERSALESEIIRKCLSRTEAQCSFMEYRGMKVIYRRYASLFFIVGTEMEEEVRVRQLDAACVAAAASGQAQVSLLAPSPLTRTPSERTRHPRVHPRVC